MTNLIAKRIAILENVILVRTARLNKLKAANNDQDAIDTARAQLWNSIKLITTLEIKLKNQKPIKTSKVVNCGYDAVKMSKTFTVKQLEKMLEQVRKEHTKENKSAGDIQLLDKKGMWKSDQITWAIYYITKKAA